MAQEFHLEIDPDKQALSPAALLAPLADLSQQQVKDAMSKGAVWLTHQGHTRRLRRHKAKLRAGDQLHLYLNSEVLSEQPLQADLIADEQRYSVWNKPAGMRSQGSKWGDHTSLPRVVEQQLQRPTFLIHRLDKAANGLILVAHTKTMARQLTQLFEQRQIEKRYRVRVQGHFPKDLVRLDQALDDKPAVSIVEKVDHQPDSSELLIRIETGRKHQIRRHLAAVGHPVLGDRLYGQTDGKLQLQAVFLAFQLNQDAPRQTYQLA